MSVKRHVKGFLENWKGGFSSATLIRYVRYKEHPKHPMGGTVLRKLRELRSEGMNIVNVDKKKSIYQWMK